MAEQPAPGQVSVATFNVRGTPLLGTGRAGRHAAIGQALEESGTDIVCFQEAHTRYHLRTLASAMPSFRHAAFRPGPAGPAGGLLILSRVPAETTGYQRLPAAGLAGLPLRTRLLARRAGALVVRAAGMHIINVHPAANRDGDWSPSSRYRALQEAQLTALAALVTGTAGPVAVCGDFNVARDSDLFTGFLADSGLADAFNGTCPPTFRREYLQPGSQPHCIDFILTGGPVKAEDAAVMLDGEPAASDHLGLRAGLYLGG